MHKNYSGLCFNNINIRIYVKMQSLLPLAIYSQSFSNELKKNHFFKAVFFFLLFKYTTLRCLYFKAAVLGVLSFCAYVFVEELQIFIALYGFSSFFFFLLFFFILIDVRDFPNLLVPCFSIELVYLF